MKKTTILLILVNVATAQLCAQSLDGLGRIKESDIYYSKGFELRAHKIESLISNAVHFYNVQLNFRPKVTVLVLNEKDWHEHTSMPVYGMPHYNHDSTLVVAATNNPMWKAFLPDLKQLPATLAKKVRETYTNENGELTMESFFDLLALHELGHAYHIQKGLNVQRKWMGELFCNIFLHTYVAERAPRLLDALVVFPEMVVSMGGSSFRFRTLDEFETNYDLLGQNYPTNYGWYQCRFHMAAGKIYDTHGADAIHRLWDSLHAKEPIADDAVLAEKLRKEVNPAISDFMLKW